MKRINELNKTELTSILNSKNEAIFSDDKRVNEYDNKTLDFLRKRSNKKEAIKMFIDLTKIKNKHDNFVKSIIKKIDDNGYYSTQTQTDLNRQLEHYYRKYIMSNKVSKFYGVNDFRTENIEYIISNYDNCIVNHHSSMQWMLKSFTFKKDNTIKCNNSSYLDTLNYLYDTKFSKYNRDTLEKEYMNGAIELKLSLEVYSTLEALKTKPYKDDKEIIDFISSHKEEIKKETGFDHVPYLKVIEVYKKINNIDGKPKLINNYSIIEDEYKRVIKN